jgi:hypothetical protein
MLSALQPLCCYDFSCGRQHLSCCARSRMNPIRPVFAENFSSLVDRNAVARHYRNAWDLQEGPEAAELEKLTGAAEVIQFVFLAMVWPDIVAYCPISFDILDVQVVFLNRTAEVSVGLVIYN